MGHSKSDRYLKDAVGILGVFESYWKVPDGTFEDPSKCRDEVIEFGYYVGPSKVPEGTLEVPVKSTTRPYSLPHSSL